MDKEWNYSESALVPAMLSSTAFLSIYVVYVGDLTPQADLPKVCKRHI